MQTDAITGISIASGIIVAGLTWFTWEFIENVAWVRADRRERPREAEAAELEERTRKQAEERKAQEEAAGKADK